MEIYKCKKTIFIFSNFGNIEIEDIGMLPICISRDKKEGMEMESYFVQ